LTVIDKNPTKNKNGWLMKGNPMETMGIKIQIIYQK